MKKRSKSPPQTSAFSGSRRRLGLSANRPKMSTYRHSAIPLISTVSGDTKSLKMSTFAKMRHSPVLQARASHRVNTIPRLLSQVISGVELPQRAITCARRSIRKEVLFARGLTGKGSKARSRQRNSSSRSKCK